MLLQIIYVVIFINNFSPCICKLNVCKTFTDYYNMNNRNCWYNPDVDLDPITIIRRHGYPVQTYEVESEDGYISTIVRMPKLNRKGIVLLEPPAFCSHAGWIDKGKNDSLGFLLWDAGYEVWLANPRGTKYGKKHRSLNYLQPKFWDFSIHEIAVYDIPAHIDFVAKVANAKDQEISFIGFSLGSTAGIAYAALKPEHSYKLFNVFIMMGANTEIHSKLNFINEVSRHVDAIEKFAERLNVYDFFSPTKPFDSLLSLCRGGPLMALCLVIDNILMGFDPEGEPAEWFPIKYTQNPSGISTKVFFHYMQIAKYQRFQQYDYGPVRNLKLYNATLPPLYAVQNIKVPIYVFQGGRDILVSLEDIERLYSKLSKEAKKYGYRIAKNFGHATFYYGKYAAEQVYRPIVRFLDKINSEN